MPTSTEVVAHSWAFAIYIIVALGLCAFMLIAAYFLGGRARARTKNVPYESGIDSVGSARLRLSAKFYLVAMFFVIFDVEALYLYLMGRFRKGKRLAWLYRSDHFHIRSAGRPVLSGAHWRSGLDAQALQASAEKQDPQQFAVTARPEDEIYAHSRRP